MDKACGALQGLGLRGFGGFSGCRRFESLEICDSACLDHEVLALSMRKRRSTKF